MLTEDRLKEIEARAEAATPGPYGFVQVFDADDGRFHVTSPGMTVARVGPPNRDLERMAAPDSLVEQRRANAAFLAGAITDVPALLAEVRRLRAEVGQLQTIFANDLLADSPALREAYERGRADGIRQTLERGLVF